MDYFSSTTDYAVVLIEDCCRDFRELVRRLAKENAESRGRFVEGRDDEILIDSEDVTAVKKRIDNALRDAGIYGEQA